MTKRLILAAVTGLALLAGSASAQTAMAPPDSGTVRSNDRAIIDRYMTTVMAELTVKIDTRSAGAGQPIAARVSADAQLADGTRLPKGTRLAGRLDQVQPQRENGGGAVLALTFDRAEPRGVPAVPLRVVLQMVSPPGGLASNAPAADTRNGVRNTGIDDSRANVGLGGADVPRTSTGTIDSGSRSPSGSNGSRGRQTAGAADPRSVNTLGGLDAGPPANVERPVVSAGETVSNAPRRTGLPGVVLVPNPAADVSGMLTSAGANITLESGTQLTLRAITR